MSRYYRTTITNEDGTIKTARIDSNTGEVRPFDYKLPEPRYKKMCSKETTTDPFWVKYLNVVLHQEEKDKKQTKVRKSKDNPNNIYLEEYMLVDDAVEEIPVLDHLLVGVSYMDIGNKQPIPKGLLFSMLRDLDFIDVNTIREYTGYSDAYCYRLAQYLRVLSYAFDREVDR